MKTTTKEVTYVSGVQASGRLHLGNYFGAIKPQIERQNLGTCFFFIADYHSLTSVYNESELRWNTQNAILDYLGLGLDPEKAIFFKQSDVPEVAELAWMLACVTPMGLLERCHAYKDKTAKGLAASAGLFTYPVLMAADILLYQANRVPVGKDQVQHLEVTRDIAEAFNHRYGKVFTIPEAEVTKDAAIVPGIDGEKMSKSRANTIPIFAWHKEIEKAVMSIITDSKGMGEPKEPVGNPVYEIYRLVASEHEASLMAERFRLGGYGYGPAKKELLRALNDHFSDARGRRERFCDMSKGMIDEIMMQGAVKAKQVAIETMHEVRKATGLTWP